MASDPRTTLRRIAPDEVQFQVMLGSLLGDGRLIGRAGDRRLLISHRADRRAYVLWKYDRLGPFADRPPCDEYGSVWFQTIEHPLLDDLARIFADPHARHDATQRLLRPLGLAVWLADIGRLELRASTFLPGQRELALAS